MSLRAGAFFALLACAFWSTAAAAQTPGPFTQDQVDAGRAEFALSCAACHGDKLQGLTAPALTGPHFTASWTQHTIADLYTFIQTSMPFCAGGTLPSQAYVNVAAFLLQQNGAQPGTTMLTADSAVKIGDIIKPAK